MNVGLVEVDLLATHAGVAPPFPLRVPSFGRITAERDVLYAVAGHTLRSRGLALDEGPVGVAAEFVAALRDHRGTVDLVLPDLRVVALVHQCWALICAQSASVVSIRRVPDTALAAELLTLVPEVSHARTLPFRLPFSALLPGETAEERLREAVRRGGGDPAVLDQLVRVLPEVTGSGRIGGSARGERTRELSWLDGPHGRIQVSRDPDGGVSVNPLRRSAIRLALEELSTSARSN